MFTIRLNSYPSFVYAHSMSIKKYEFTNRNYTFMEIVYVLKGAITMSLNKVNYHADEGSCLIILPGTAADCCVDTNYGYHAHLSVGIRCGIDCIENICKIPNAISFTGNVHQKINNKELFISVFEDIIRAYNHNDYNEMLSQYIQLCNAIHKNNTSPARKENTYIYSKKIIDYIETNYMSKISLPRISDYLSITPEYACNLFKAETGETIVDFTNRKRIDKAKVLLLKGGISIQYVANMVGFQSTSYFSRTFKKYEGISPSEYKRALQRSYLNY